MDYNLTPGVPGPLYLLQGCCTEAERADRVALGLDGLRAAIPEVHHAYMSSVADEVRASARLLRELADKSQVHIQRLPTVLNYLNVLLPCLCKTLRDMTAFYEDKTISRELRWRKMYHTMSGEGKIALPQRFTLYNHFLTLLGHLLTRSPQFDLNTLDILQERILKLREERGIPRPPAQVGPVVTSQALMQMGARDRNDHWATEIFSRPLPSRTTLKTKRHRRSETHGPYSSLGEVMRIPPDSRMLFRRLFDNDNIAVSVYLNPANKSPFILVRHYYNGASFYCLRGVHELCIRQSGDALQLKRWSTTQHCGKPWAALCFLAWEDLVLFHCTFVALKANSILSVELNPEEYKLRGERRLFQARILDDDFQHSLIVYRETETGGIRLHAAVADGELKQCPIWTAFVTHQSQSPTWLERKGKYVVWLKDIQLYVFCKRYREERMRQNKAGAFEIHFQSAEAASRFREVFYTPPAPASVSVMQPAEITEASEPTPPESSK